MKKLFLFTCLAIFGTLTAQTEKGRFVISGETNLGFTSTSVKYTYGRITEEGPKTTSFNISPSVSYFVIDNLAIGLEFDYRTSTTKQQREYYSDYGYDLIDLKTTQTTVSVLPTATYYFSKGKLRPYIEAGIGFANTKLKEEASNYGEYESNSDGLVWGAGGGLAYFITNSVSFDFGLGYSEYTYKEEDIKITTGAFGVNVGISVFLK